MCIQYTYVLYVCMYDIYTHVCVVCVHDISACVCCVCVRKPLLPRKLEWVLHLPALRGVSWGAPTQVSPAPPRPAPH